MSNKELVDENRQLISVLKHMVKLNDLLVQYRSRLQQLAMVIGDGYYNDLYGQLEDQYQNVVKEGDQIDLSQFVEVVQIKKPASVAKDLNRTQATPEDSDQDSIGYTPGNEEMEGCSSSEEPEEIKRKVERRPTTRRVASDDEDEGPPYKCQWPGCSETFRQKPTRNRHHFKHKATTPVACVWPGCVHSTLPQHMYGHVKRVHFKIYPPRRYACHWPECDKRFYSQSHLDTHVRSHTQDKALSCDFEGCVYKTTSSQALRSHKFRMHLKTGPHKCDWPGCGQEFFVKKEWRRHKNRHTGVKDKECPWPGCSKMFNVIIERKHMIMHRRQASRAELEKKKTAAVRSRGDGREEES